LHLPVQKTKQIQEGCQGYDDLVQLPTNSLLLLFRPGKSISGIACETVRSRLIVCTLSAGVLTDRGSFYTDSFLRLSFPSQRARQSCKRRIPAPQSPSWLHNEDCDLTLRRRSYLCARSVGVGRRSGESSPHIHIWNIRVSVLGMAYNSSG
jgi:hypothetical protein